MSDILLSWLNDKVLLSKRITSLTDDFSNGYLFGELLHKYKCIDNFNKYINSSEIEEKEINFNMLSESLYSMKLDFSDQIRKRIVLKDKISIGLFLYKLKNFLERKECNFNQIVLKTAKNKMSLKSIMLPSNKEKLLSSMSLDQIRSLKSNSLTKSLTLTKEVNKQQYLDRNSLSVIPQHVMIRQEGKSNLKETIKKDNNPNEGMDKEHIHLVREETFQSKKTYDMHGSNSANNIFNQDDNVQYVKLYDKRNQDSQSESNNNLSLVQVEQMKNKIVHSFHPDLFINQMNCLGLKLNEFEIKRIKHKTSEDVETFAKKLIMNKLNSKFKEKQIIKKDNESSHRQMINNLFDIKTLAPINKNISKSVSSLNQHDIRIKYETKRLGEIKQKKIVKKDETFHCKLLKHIFSYQHYKPIEEETFNQASYFRILDKEQISLIREKITVNEIKKRIDYSLMSMTFDQIFDFAFEAVIYQTDTNEDNVTIDQWREWNNCFVSGGLLRQPVANDLTKQLKHTIEEEDYSKEGFSLDDLCNFEDYLHYLGRWNIVLPPPLKKVDFRIEEIYKNAYFNHHGLSNDIFEPNEEESNNLLLPKDMARNYLLGDMISHVVNLKYNSKDIKHSIGKYNHLTVKLCFIGYPCSGRKSLAKKIQEEYPNVNVYVMSNIISNMVKEYKRINMPIEDNPKYKMLKKGQMEQLMQEREKDIKEFKEVSDILSSYINILMTNSKAEPTDDLMFQIFKYQLEKDFSNVKSSNKRNDELITLLKRKVDFILQLDSLKQENAKTKKPKIKEEESLQREICKLNNEAYKGFILIDYPRTLNQFTQVENYLTDYIPEMHKPKTEKSLLLSQISTIIDFNPPLPSINHFIQSGFDFIIDFKVNSTEINRRYQGLRYDPITTQFYQLDDNSPLDKKIKERLIPPDVLSLNQLNNQINEYNSNQENIKAFYCNFGHERLNIKSYHAINAITREDELYSLFKATILQNIAKLIEEKEKEIIDGGNTKIHININAINHNIDLISKDISPIVTQNANDQLTLSNRNESKMAIKKLNLDGISNSYLSQIIINDNIINQLKHFIDKYKLECLTYVKFLLKQISRISNRMVLMQKVFEQYLSTPTNKIKYINIYMKKYSSFFFEYPYYISNIKVTNHFRDDIRLLLDKIWLVIQNKKQASITEYNQIRNFGFIDKEKTQLYNHIETIFISEASKYLCFIELIKQYHMKIDTQTDSLSSLVSPNDIKVYLTKNMSYENKIANLFKGCFFLLAKTDFTLKDIFYSKIIQTTHEGTNTKRTKRINCTLSDNREGTFQDEIRGIIHSTKQQFKYRIMILRYYAIEQYNTITKVYCDVLDQMDKWIIQSVRMQNEAMNQLAQNLNESLDAATIPSIENIEHDKFHYDIIDPSMYFNCNLNKESISTTDTNINVKANVNINVNYYVNSFKVFIEEVKKYESVPGYIKSDDLVKVLISKIESKKKQNSLNQNMKAFAFRDLNHFINQFEICYMNNKSKYESYLEINKILTLIMLSTCVVPDKMHIVNIIEQSKSKLINSTCISKDDYFQLNFWFDALYENKSKAMKELLFYINKIENEDLLDIYSLCEVFSLGLITNAEPQSTFYDLLFVNKI